MKRYLKKDVLAILATYIVLAASTGVYFPFNALYLASTLNFSGSQISFMDGTGQLAAMVFLPIAGIITDKTQKPSYTFIFLMIASSILMFFYAQLNSFMYVSLIYIGFLMFRRGIFPILDALALNVCTHHELNFGFFRSIYSAFFMLFAIGVGFYFKGETTIDNTFIYLSIFFNILVIILALFIPKLKIVSKKKLNLRVDLKELIRNKKFVLTSISVALIMATVSIISMYNSMIISDLGGDLNNIGLSTVMQMGPEILLSVFALRLTKRHHHLKIMVISTLILLMRWILVAIFYTYSIYYYTIWIEGFATIFILILGMDYVRTIVQPQLIATSITIYTSITLLAYAILVNVSGAIIDNYGIKYVFILLIIITILGLVFIIPQLIHKKQITSK